MSTVGGSNISVESSSSTWSAVSFSSSAFYLRLTFTTLALVVLVFALLSKRMTWPKNAPKQSLTSWPIVGATGFFTARWDFLKAAAGHSPSGQHRFDVGKYGVVGLSGEQARRLFFENRQLSFSEGYATLLAAAPVPPPNPTTEGEEGAYSDGFSSYFSSRLVRLFQRERLTQSLPLITNDTYTALKDLAASGAHLTDPFESIYQLVYKLTMRTVGCADIADSPALLKKTLAWYSLVENASSATAILYPRLPTIGFLQRTYGGARLYMLLKGIVDGRKKTGTRVEDPLQYLIDQGDDMMHIIQFVMGALFAGLLNSGINAAFVLVYLASSPEWASKVYAEVVAVVSKYDQDTSKPLADRLAAVPLEAWESDLHTIDLCTRDSIRLQTLGAALRKNSTNHDIPIGETGEVIPAGAFVAYPLADVHMDPAIYPNPEKWDPARYLSPRNEDKKAPLGFVGWGAGRHPCLGMRFAKLEQNVIIAYWIAMFETSLCEADGSPASEPPLSDINGWTAGKPKRGCRLRFRARGEEEVKA